MNKNMIWMQELKMLQRSLAVWGRFTPELFTFAGQTNKGMVRYD